MTTKTRNRKSRPLIDRFTDRVDKDSNPPHWLWTGAPQRNGYGVLRLPANGPLIYVHRFAYEHFIGPIPDGFDVGHDCHDKDKNCPGGNKCWHRLCCNPFGCLKLQIRANNLKSSNKTNSGKTHCKWGHEFSNENTLILSDGERMCLECKRRRDLENQLKKAQRKATLLRQNIHKA